MRLYIEEPSPLNSAEHKFANRINVSQLVITDVGGGGVNVSRHVDINDEAAVNWAERRHDEISLREFDDPRDGVCCPTRRTHVARSIISLLPA